MDWLQSRTPDPALERLLAEEEAIERGVEAAKLKPKAALAAVVTNLVFAQRGWVFGGYVRDLLSGDIHKPDWDGDLDIVIPERGTTKFLNGLLNLGSVGLERLAPTDSVYASIRCQVQVGQDAVQVDLKHNDLVDTLDLSVNALRMSNTAVWSVGYPVDLAMQDIGMRRFRVLKGLSDTRQAKRERLIQKGWTEYR